MTVLNPKSKKKKKATEKERKKKEGVPPPPLTIASVTLYTYCAFSHPCIVEVKTEITQVHETITGWMTLIKINK